ncbi:hypothetical protein FNV43_RR10550 [Rhamnella rubrinervis]|uniref:Pectinesterase inhibitor domain-containing protein n=1 Tax=Rhamnella rubrinervis TaxID=2594499 RepID=A0A8K0H4A6_9ROSA|nr:hypothetical protein FNV43_RR10550 [Rhamnella rubrinervis]
MDSQTHLFTSFTFICSVLFLSSLSQANAEASKIVDSVCKETISPARCQEALATNPLPKDLNGLAQATLRLAIANAKNSFDFINKLIAKNNASEPIKQCAFWYKEVVASFQSALGELEDDISSANYDSKVAGDSAEACEEGLVSKGVQMASISTRNEQVKLFSNIAFVITSRLDV